MVNVHLWNMFLFLCWVHYLDRAGKSYGRRHYVFLPILVNAIYLWCSFSLVLAKHVNTYKGFYAV